jgi:hypothetical protein
MKKHHRITTAILVWLAISATALAFAIVWLRDTPMSLDGQVFAGFITALLGLITLILSVMLTDHLVTGNGKERK